jgi:hypothetical protein
VGNAFGELGVPEIKHIGKEAPAAEAVGVEGEWERDALQAYLRD